jgi:transcription antitermination factor NusG
MSEVYIDDANMQTHVTDMGTRSFCPLTSYLKAPQLPDDDPHQQHEWYPLYVSFQREMKVKEVLDNNNFETFLPMTVRTERVGKSIVHQRVPALRNFIFIRSYYQRIRWMKMYNRVCTALQFMSHGSLRVEDTIIPQYQMETFIQASIRGEGKEHVVYLTPQEIEEFKGKEVQFVEGDFKGIRGYIQRVNKNKMVIVTLKGIQSIALPVSRKNEIVFVE